MSYYAIDDGTYVTGLATVVGDTWVAPDNYTEIASFDEAMVGMNADLTYVDAAQEEEHKEKIREEVRFKAKFYFQETKKNELVGNSSTGLYHAAPHYLSYISSLTDVPTVFINADNSVITNMSQQDFDTLKTTILTYAANLFDEYATILSNIQQAATKAAIRAVNVEDYS